MTSRLALVLPLAWVVMAQPPPPIPARRPAPQAPRVPLNPEDYGAVEGMIVNALTGEALRKATVRVRRTDGQGRGASFSATTDAAGRYAISDLEPGAYRVTAERNGFVESEYGARGTRRQGSPVTVGKGQRVRDIQVRLTPHGVIAGRVRDEDGEPVARATVQLFRWSYEQGRKTLTPSLAERTNDLGEFRVFGVPPGRYVLSAALGRMDAFEGFEFGARGPLVPPRPLKESEESYVPAYYPNTVDPASAATLEVGPGATLEGMDVNLRKVRTVRVRGIVQRPPATAAPDETGGRGGRGFGGIVQLIPRNSVAPNNGARVSPVDGEGRFEIRSVTPGSYNLVAGGPGGPQDRVTARMPIEIGGSSIDGIVLAPANLAPLTGIVRLEGDAPSAAGALTFNLAPLDHSALFGLPPAIRVKDDLTFEARNVSGDRYRLVLANTPAAYFLKSVRFNEVESPDLTITVPPTGGGQLAITLSSKGGSLEGQVTNEARQPAANSTVLLWPKDRPERFDLIRTATANGQGQYSFSGLAPGDYRLVAIEEVERGAEFDPEFRRRLDSSAEMITVKELSRSTKAIKEIRVP